MSDKFEKEYVTPPSAGDAKEKFGNFFQSVREHLSEDYRKQFLIRKIICCIFVFYFWLLLFVESMGTFALVLSMVLTWLSFIFWHYSYWNFQGGIIQNFLDGLIRFGTFWQLVQKTILQYVLIYFWITLVAPVFGILAWRKAVKHNKILYVANERRDRWNED